MTAPRRRKGFRAIVVGGVTYRWAFRPGPTASVLVVYGEASNSARLEVHMPDWRDPWYNVDRVVIAGDELHLGTSVANAPAVVSSGFARRAIEAGLAAGFAAARPGQTLRLVFAEDRFARA